MQEKGNNLLYLYDLPKENVTSIKIATVLKDNAKYEPSEVPQIKRDANKPFYTAMIRINDKNQAEYKEICKNMKYFEIDGKPCRALPFDKELLGSNRNQTNKNTVFVKGFDKNMTSKQLEEMFSQFGEVKSAKVSINPDYSSRRYGFVCFNNPEDTKKAVEGSQNLGGISVEFYNPKDRREIRKAFNNIYVKNFPPEWSDDQLKQLFGQYGNIKSLAIMQNERQPGVISKFAFVCYEDPTGNDKEYGPRAAMNAVKELHEKTIDGNVLYVRDALKKSEREYEKKKEQMRFKNSKKRCNLYVKNFPAQTSEAQLKEYFGKYGDIESVKIFKKDEEAVYAFVCFKNPDHAALARQQLNQQTFMGKILYINHYEIKEIRKIQQEEIRDKADFQNFKKQNQGPFNLEMINRPEIFTLIQQLIMYMQRSQPQFKGGMGFRGGPRQPRGPHQQHQPGSMPKPMQQQPGQMPPMGGQPAPMMNQPMQRPPMGMMPPQMPPQGMPMPGMATPGMPVMTPNVNPNLPPYIIDYNTRGFQLVPAVVPQNPNYKAQVGEFIYEFVEKIAGEEKAPKITGMLIDLPIDEIKGYLTDFQKLQGKIAEANTLLQQI